LAVFFAAAFVFLFLPPPPVFFFARMLGQPFIISTPLCAIS
jgi:hypothetical protein